MPRAISTIDAPAAKGPYSQAVVIDNLVFVSGQIALTAKGELISGTIEEETQQIMSNLQAILAAAGFTLDNIVKTTIYLTDTSLFACVNEVYGSFFKSTLPARETIGAASLPLGARIEISVIAATGQ